MSFNVPEDRLTRQELAWELVEIFEELHTDKLNEMIAMNVPLDTMEFFSAYANEFAETAEADAVVSPNTRNRLPNLMLLGYLLRLLEERLPVEPEPFDA